MFLITEALEAGKEELQMSKVDNAENGSVMEDGKVIEDVRSDGLEHGGMSFPEQSLGSGVQQEEPVAAQEPTDVSVGQENGSGEVHDGLEVGGRDKFLYEAETETVSNVQFLGEHLFPAEAALLAEICRMRIGEFGSDTYHNGLDEETPKGLGGLGLVGQKSVQSKSSPTKKELLMALKIRRQEQQTLLKAIERGSRYQHSHSKECRHHCC